MKKRGIFWISAPAAAVVAGIVILALNGLTSATSGLHVIVNLIDFLLIGAGVIAFVPGLIYGIVLLTKK